MDGIKEKIKEAQKAGYGDDEIIQFLAQMPTVGTQINTALENEYKPSEILKFLAESKSKAFEAGAKLGTTTRALASAAGGPTFGFADELAGFLGAPMLAMQKGDMKQGETYIRQAIRAGLPDNENNAAAYLQLCSIMMNKREYRAAKEFFRKAKSYKPTTPQIVDQIKQIEKYITRMPG